ncbi:DUF3592 domain-containing protein [Planctomicrobium sp. SH664]|uniref:DUF3592 domain-containing protein n=1 Tax=Planctomicrobium sp. SH664 TaxID=3448125 RepID=UPI003F5AE4D9
MPEGVLFVIILCAAFPTVILIALGVKLYEVRQASGWPETTGRVVESRIGAQRVRQGNGRRELRQQPRVVYEYRVGNEKLRCDRITIGERFGPEEIEEVLDRYPVGQEVTVYYNPARPQQALLERDLPAGKVLLGIVFLLGFFIAAPVFVAALYGDALKWLQPWVANPKQIPFVAAVGTMGLLSSLFALALQKMSRQARSWPIAQGQILSTSAESFRDWSGARGGERFRKHYKPLVVYGYEVNGRRYIGDQVSLGVRLSSTSAGLARRQTESYPVGSLIDIHYNPRCPSESVIHPGSAWLLFPWLISAVLFALAWAVATGRIG